MIHLDDLVAANPGLEVRGAAPDGRYARFAFDSRLVESGDLFVAVRTQRGDGHDHVADAFGRGALAALVDDPTAVRDGRAALVVDDTVAAMERYGAYVVRLWKPRIVAVTGTVGKTGTKELVADVLATRFTVFRTPGNYSGRFGLAVALGGLRPEHEVAVIEMATGHFGEIDAMCAVAPPEVGVVTAVDAAHLVALGDVDGVAREKGALLTHLPPDGLAVLSADDPRVVALTPRSAAPVVTFGTSPDAGYRADDVVVDRTGTTFTCTRGPWHATVVVPWLGAHSAGAALAGLAVADHFGIDRDDAVAAIGRLASVPGRLRPLAGAGGSLILDDTYNAAPRSVHAGLDTLARLPAGRRIAVIGDMAELAGASEELHREVGRHAAATVDVLVTQGNAAAWIADAAVRAGLPADSVAITFTPEDAASEVATRLVPDSVVLVKGSAAARMERVVERLLAEGGDSEGLLVRQDRAWRSIRIVQPDRPTWLEIDLSAVGHNVGWLAGRAGGAQVMVVLKADAYGHGAVQVAHTALRNGATWLGVACVPEARDLRRAGIRTPVLVLGYTPGWQGREAIGLDLTLAVFDSDTARELGRAALALDTTVSVHVKVDTGMHRLGVDVHRVTGFVAELHAIAGLEVTGLFTHFACADDRTPTGVATTDRQVAAFRKVIAELDAEGILPPLVHASNSAGLLCREDAVFDLVRPGIAVYGLPPGPDVPVPDLRPALAWKSQVAQVHDLAAGESVGYGHLWTAERPSRVATVPVGYADGLRRAPATWQYVLVRGRPAPLAGRVSMDQVSVDVTDVPGARRGDEVVLIGRQGAEELPATLVADWLGTSCYEVVAEILARVPRVN
ncbi:MAG: alanine racemase [Acidimicrobiales bacterium]